jgi:hypothetical protein
VAWYCRARQDTERVSLELANTQRTGLIGLPILSSSTRYDGVAILAGNGAAHETLKLSNCNGNGLVQGALPSMQHSGRLALRNLVRTRRQTIVVYQPLQRLVLRIRRIGGTRSSTCRCALGMPHCIVGMVDGTKDGRWLGNVLGILEGASDGDSDGISDGVAAGNLRRWVSSMDCLVSCCWEMSVSLDGPSKLMTEVGGVAVPAIHQHHW